MKTIENIDTFGIKIVSVEELYVNKSIIKNTCREARWRFSGWSSSSRKNSIPYIVLIFMTL